MIKNFRKNYKSILSVSVFVFVWQMVAAFELVRPVFIGTPTRIAEELIELFLSGFIFLHLFSSLQSLFWGLFFSLLIGIVGGVLVGVNKSLYEIFSPYIFGINALPKVAIMPLIIIWFGIGLEAKVVIIFLMALTPIMVATIDGARSVDQKLLDMAASFNASKLFIIKNVIFPGSLPMIFSGVRIATGRAVIGMIVAEFFGLGRGLGYLVSFFGATLQTDKMMAVLIVILVLNIALLASVDIIKRKYTWVGSGK